MQGSPTVPTSAPPKAIYRAGGIARLPRSFMRERETRTASHRKPGARGGRSVASGNRCSVKHGVGGFTLVELLVTIGVIAVLASLLVPSLRYGKFRAKVTQCSNNMRQIAIACQLYAADGNKGLLPSYMLPTGSGRGVVEPWIVAFGMITNVETYGVGPRMWYCPTRDKWDIINGSYKLETGKTIETGADLVAHYHLTDTPMVPLDMFWWVPRPLEGLNTSYPDPKLLKTRTGEPWPTKVEDATAATQPIASD
jgi:prepilin-type N-terminal cleavage/methylation domain-containing protein